MAPCRPEDRLTLMKMLEYVEGMSLDAMQKGIRWEFETFREYLDALDRLPLWVNVAPLIGHSAVRQFVMGDAAWEREATHDELERMGDEVRRAMADGAIGFSSTTNLNHVGDRGRPVPSRLGTRPRARVPGRRDGLDRPRHRRAHHRREPARPRGRGRPLRGAGARRAAAGHDGLRAPQSRAPRRAPPHPREGRSRLARGTAPASRRARARR